MQGETLRTKSAVPASAGGTGTGSIRVASVPAGHVYVRHLSPPSGGDAVVRLADPVPREKTVLTGQWWPPVMLSPSWVLDHHDEFDVFHIQFGFDAKETKAGLRATFLCSEWIRNSTSEHLVASADAQNPTAAFHSVEEQFFEATVNEPSQIGNRVLGSGNNHEIRRASPVRLTHIFNSDTRDAFEWIEVRVIRNARQPDDGDPERSRFAAMIFQRHAIFLVNA